MTEWEIACERSRDSRFVRWMGEAGIAIAKVTREDLREFLPRFIAGAAHQHPPVQIPSDLELGEIVQLTYRGDVVRIGGIRRFSTPPRALGIGRALMRLRLIYPPPTCGD